MSSASHTGTPYRAASADAARDLPTPDAPQTSVTTAGTRSGMRTSMVDQVTTVAGLADELLDAIHARHPLSATLDGFRDRDDLLPDYSEAGEAATAARFGDILARTRALDPVGLPPADRLTCAVIRNLADATLDELATHSVEYTVTPLLFVSPAAQPLVGLPLVTLLEPAHADGYLARLRAIPALLDTLADRHRAGIAAGRLPVRGLVDGAVAHLDRYLANRDRNPLRRPRPPTADSAFDAERDRLVDGAVRVAYERYRTVLAGEVAPHARPDDRAGLCWLPDGEEVLATARAAVARAEQAAPDWFGRLPRQRCTIEAVPADEAPGAPAAYYMGPALDGSRPGIYFANTHKARERGRYTAEAAAYHEAVP